MHTDGEVRVASNGPPNQACCPTTITFEGFLYASEVDLRYSPPTSLLLLTVVDCGYSFASSASSSEALVVEYQSTETSVPEYVSTHAVYIVG